jgi:methyl-accepting chemotaxis protein
LTLKEQSETYHEANQFLVAHCEKTLRDIKEAYNDVARGYRGIAHSVNLSNASGKDCCEAVSELRTRCDKLERERDESFAAIGQLQEQVATLKEAMEACRKAYAELKNVSKKGA